MNYFDAEFFFYILDERIQFDDRHIFGPFGVPFGAPKGPLNMIYIFDDEHICSDDERMQFDDEHVCSDDERMQFDDEHIFSDDEHIISMMNVYSSMMNIYFPMMNVYISMMNVYVSNMIITSYMMIIFHGPLAFHSIVHNSRTPGVRSVYCQA